MNQMSVLQRLGFLTVFFLCCYFQFGTCDWFRSTDSWKLNCGIAEFLLVQYAYHTGYIALFWGEAWLSQSTAFVQRMAVSIIFLVWSQSWVKWLDRVGSLLRISSPSWRSLSVGVGCINCDIDDHCSPLALRQKRL
jgi:hypothetical protein